MQIKVGCCGVAGISLFEYAKLFDVMEVQSTFYQLPMLKTAERWRSTVPENFEFTVKAFQGITHPLDSPTWKRTGKQKPTRNPENYGFLKPTRENFHCWDNTIGICSILKATICVLQLPPSYVYTRQNADNMTKFLQHVSDGVRIAIEFRHNSWSAIVAELEKLFSKFRIIQIVDPLKSPSTYRSDAAYYRLHGLGERMYKYQYTSEDLKRLKEAIQRAEGEHAYVMFNNVCMKDDALRFAKMI